MESHYCLAQATGLPRTRIRQIARGKRAISTDMALRLSKARGVDDPFSINLHAEFAIEVERDLHADDPAKVVTLVALLSAGSALLRESASRHL